jgi:hypothetical protein
MSDVQSLRVGAGQKETSILDFFLAERAARMVIHTGRIFFPSLGVALPVSGCGVPPIPVSLRVYIAVYTRRVVVGSFLF